MAGDQETVALQIVGRQPAQHRAQAVQAHQEVVRHRDAGGRQARPARDQQVDQRQADRHADAAVQHLLEQHVVEVEHAGVATAQAEAAVQPLREQSRAGRQAATGALEAQLERLAAQHRRQLVRVGHERAHHLRHQQRAFEQVFLDRRNGLVNQNGAVVNRLRNHALGK